MDDTYVVVVDDGAALANLLSCLGVVPILITDTVVSRILTRLAFKACKLLVIIVVNSNHGDLCLFLRRHLLC